VPSLPPAQLEPVRRWASTMYMVARQEMEHLSLANSILTAIGELPWFSRENIPENGLQSPFLDGKQTPAALVKANDMPAREPKPFPFTLAPFSERRIQSLICAESPSWQEIPPSTEPKPTWCFCDDPASLNLEGTGAAGFQAAQQTPPKRGRSHRRLLALQAPTGDQLLSPEEFHAGLIQDLYAAIRRYLVAHPGLFKNPTMQQVQIPVEYNIYIFPVTDWSSAARAIDQILREGEGFRAAPGSLSHFERFTSIYREFLAQQKPDAARKLLVNPQRSQIKNVYTGKVFDTFNEGYCTLLLMLDALYANFVPQTEEKYPHFSTALAQTAFAPAMTMLIRSLGEILVQLPTLDDKDSPRTGPSFDIDLDTQARLEHPEKKPRHIHDITFFVEKWNALADRTGELVNDEAAPASLKDSIKFLDENTKRIAANVRQIYQQGNFKKFVAT
jgi:hypothetical protein